MGAAPSRACTFLNKGGVYAQESTDHDHGPGLGPGAGHAAAAETRGVTADTIKIGQWGPQTGPAALWGAVARGSDLLFKVVNEEGGINGRKVEYFLRDDGYQPNRTKAIVKELVEKEGVFGFVGGVGTSPGMAAMPYLLEHNAPWVAPSTGSTHWAFPPKKLVFAVYPNYPDEAQILIRYLVETMGKKKIAFLYQNDDYGKGGLEGARMEMKKQGMELVAEVPMEITETDLSSHVLKLKEAEADCVILWLLPKQAAITLGTAAKMGFRPQWASTSTLADAPLMYKITKGLWKGVIFDTFGELPGSKNPLMVKYHKAQQKYMPKERWGVFFTVGIGFAEPMVEAMRRAGKDLTVDSFVEAMNSLDNFQGILGKISFAPDKRQGQTEVFLAKCKEGGKAERISDWISVR